MRRRQRLLAAVFALSLAGCVDGSPSESEGEEPPDIQSQSTPLSFGGLLQALKQPSRGAPIAVAPNGAVAVVVNRDAGSATVLAVRAKEGKSASYHGDRRGRLGRGSEPWQAVVAPSGETAFVVLRKDQKLVRIRGLSHRALRRWLCSGRFRANLGRAQSDRAYRIRDQLGQWRHQRGQYLEAEGHENDRPQ